MGCFNKRTYPGFSLKAGRLSLLDYNSNEVGPTPFCFVSRPPVLDAVSALFREAFLIL